MSIKNFSQYLSEEKGTAYFTFGRMNPPTVGHGKLFDKLAAVSGSSPYFIFVSQTTDAKKNPLTYSDKIKHLRKMFPKHARSVLINKNIRTAFDALTHLYDKGFKDVIMVVGADRTTEFEARLNEYNGKKGRHGFYNFRSIKTVSAGDRDPDAEGVTGMSASKQRANAKNNDFASFSQGIPRGVSTRDARKLFNDVRRGMGLKEQANFKNHVELDTVSERREQYIRGELFSVGDEVVVRESGDLGNVSWLGSNYLVVKLSEEESKRVWIDDVVKLDELVLPSTLANMDPKLDRLLHRVVNKKAYKKAVKYYIQYHKERNSKKDKNDSLWKVSQITGADYRNLVTVLNKMVKDGDIPAEYAIKEESDAVAQARERIQQQKARNKERYDRILDRARIIRAKKKNRKT